MKKKNFKRNGKKIEKIYKNNHLKFWILTAWGWIKSREAVFDGFFIFKKKTDMVFEQSSRLFSYLLALSFLDRFGVFGWVRLNKKFLVLTVTWALRQFWTKTEFIKWNVGRRWSCFKPIQLFTSPNSEPKITAQRKST